MIAKNIRWFVFAVLVVVLAVEYVYIPYFCQNPLGLALPFWQHPPKVIVMHSLYLISPSLVKAAELLFWTLGLGMWLGFRQISSTNVFDHEDRKKLFLFIRDHPGVHFRQLERDIGMNRGTLTYHLDTLVHEGKLVTLENSGYSRYFENSGKYSLFERKILSSLNNDRRFAIVRMLMSSPVRMEDFKQNLGMSGPAIAWHLNRMRSDKIVNPRGAGRNITYALNGEALAFLQKHLNFLAAPVEINEPGKLDLMSTKSSS